MSIPNPSSVSDRVILTPSAYARAHYLYAQEIGSLRSLKPHISSRDQIDSFLFLIVLTAIIVYVTTSTKFGKQLYAAGSNERAARLSGINVDNVELALQAGANVIVAGSAVFKSDIAANVKSFLTKMRG